MGVTPNPFTFNEPWKKKKSKTIIPIYTLERKMIGTHTNHSDKI